MSERDGATRILMSVLHGCQTKSTRIARDQLRAAVIEYVAEMKSRGWPPERVLVNVKELAHEAGLRQGYLAIDDDGDPSSQLLTDIVAWCIEQYYA
jgi:hypothetical protein